MFFSVFGMINMWENKHTGANIFAYYGDCPIFAMCQSFQWDPELNSRQAYL